tara:strand:+ start:298 stop:483 length:186 start_codon:yes stop_codon:yes gene_type:complete
LENWKDGQIRVKTVLPQPEKVPAFSQEFRMLLAVNNYINKIVLAEQLELFCYSNEFESHGT